VLSSSGELLAESVVASKSATLALSAWSVSRNVTTLVSGHADGSLYLHTLEEASAASVDHAAPALSFSASHVLSPPSGDAVTALELLSLGAGLGRVLVATHGDGRLSARDPRSGKLVARAHTGTHNVLALRGGATRAVHVAHGGGIAVAHFMPPGTSSNTSATTLARCRGLWTNETLLSARFEPHQGAAARAWAVSSEGQLLRLSMRLPTRAMPHTACVTLSRRPLHNLASGDQRHAAPYALALVAHTSQLVVADAYGVTVFNGNGNGNPSAAAAAVPPPQAFSTPYAALPGGDAAPGVSGSGLAQLVHASRWGHLLLLCVHDTLGLYEAVGDPLRATSHSAAAGGSGASAPPLAATSLWEQPFFVVLAALVGGFAFHNARAQGWGGGGGGGAGAVGRASEERGGRGRDELEPSLVAALEKLRARANDE